MKKQHHKNSIPNNYFFVKYRTEEGRPAFGEIKGQVIEISPAKEGEDKRGSKEGNWLGFTKMPRDKTLWDRLLTGVNTVDVEKSTPDKIVASDTIDLFRKAATQFVSLTQADWKCSPYYQEPASEQVYSEYIRTFLCEFTKVTKHIPTTQLIEYYPHAWIFPSKTSLFVGRDALAIQFEYPSRPENTEIFIDDSKILENLLLPHLENKRYTSSGPMVYDQFICTDEDFVHIRGDGSYPIRSELGNPSFIVMQKNNHEFWENLGILRGYGDGTSTKKHFDFVEIFGDISEANFTKEKAIKRAQLYAELWFTNKVSGGKVNQVSKLRSLIEEFKILVSTEDTSEHEIESFIDNNPWFIERSLGYKRYHSQVTIDESLLSRSDQDIRPDKFLERNDGYCDVLDLKRADASVFISKPNRAHASAKLTEAEAQVDVYVDFVKEPKVRDNLRERGIKVLSPNGLVIMGKNPEREIDSWENVKKRLSVKVFTYDDVINELETIISWIEAILQKNQTMT